MMLREGMSQRSASLDLMSNLPVVVANVKDRFLEVAKEAERLADALHNVAPSQLSAGSSSNTTVRYLFEITDQLRAYAKECDILLKK